MNRLQDLIKKAQEALGRSPSGRIGRKQDLGTQLAVFRAGQGWTRDQINKEWQRIKGKDVTVILDIVKTAMIKKSKD